MQTKVDKPVFNFARGLVSEASPLGFPEGATLNEENFELLINGTRRKRRGLTDVGELADVDIEGNSRPSYNNWTRVIAPGNFDGPDIIVLKYGHCVFFWEDEDDWSNSTIRMISLSGYKAGSATNADIVSAPVSFATGRGQLFISGRYIETVHVVWEDDLDTYEALPINPRRRWYEDYEDDIPIADRPLFKDTTTEEYLGHEFNLASRGWTQSDIAQFELDVGSAVSEPDTFPSKADIWYKGYVREDTVLDASADWTKTFKGEVLYSEAFGNQSAPRGSIICDLYDSDDVELRGGARQPVHDLWVNDDNQSLPGQSGPNTPVPGTWTNGGSSLTVTTGKFGFIVRAAQEHGLNPSDTIYLKHTKFAYRDTDNQTRYHSLEGSHTVVDTRTDDLAFYCEIDSSDVTDNGGFGYWKYIQGNWSQSDLSIPDSIRLETDERAAVNGYYAGRLWLGGIKEDRLSDFVFFSQVSYAERQDWDKLYQEGDPASPDYQQIVPDDGGSIQISGLQNLKALVPLGSSLVVLAESGIWEIRGGQGYFAANDYLVRKISEVDCKAATGVVEVEGTLMFASSRGIYAITPDPQQGFLVVNSLTDNIIETFYRDQTDRFTTDHPTASYNDISKKVYFGFTETESGQWTRRYLIFDARLQAWSYEAYDGERIIATIPSWATERGEYDRMQFVYMVNAATDTMNVADHSTAQYTDLGSSYDAFLELGYDWIEDWQRFKQAAYIMCYMQKTETGYTDSGGEMIPINESDMTMQARWDWSDNSNANKWSREQQIYRHRRLYSPADVNDEFENGHPVVVTKNKVRGRGRALHLYFDASQTDKPAHLLGWAIQYKGNSKI